MSKNSSRPNAMGFAKIPARDLKHLKELLGTASPTKRRTDDLEIPVARFVRKIRGRMNATIKESGVGVREIARRLSVSPTLVSRHLRSEGDIKASTMALLLHAIGYEWEAEPRPLPTAQLKERKWTIESIKGTIHLLLDDGKVKAVLVTQSSPSDISTRAADAPLREPEISVPPPAPLRKPYEQLLTWTPSAVPSREDNLVDA